MSNEACGCYCGFCSHIYPITPASEVMEYMIKNMDKLGATIVQTEDEIKDV